MLCSLLLNSVICIGLMEFLTLNDVVLDGELLIGLIVYSAIINLFFLIVVCLFDKEMAIYSLGQPTIVYFMLFSWYSFLHGQPGWHRYISILICLSLALTCSYVLYKFTYAYSYYHLSNRARNVPKFKDIRAGMTIAIACQIIYAAAFVALFTYFI
jgi:hypothetical protein